MGPFANRKRLFICFLEANFVLATKGDISNGVGENEKSVGKKRGNEAPPLPNWQASLALLHSRIFSRVGERGKHHFSGDKNATSPYMQYVQLSM